MESSLRVNFVVAASAGGGATFVEGPDAIVGEDAPADAAVGVDVGGGKIAEYLAVGRAGLAACVERPVEVLALGDGEGIGVTFGGGFGGGKVFGLGVAEEEVVGDVFVVVAALRGGGSRPSRGGRRGGG